MKKRVKQKAANVAAWKVHEQFKSDLGNSRNRGRLS